METELTLVSPWAHSASVEPRTGQIHGWTTGPLPLKPPVIGLRFSDCTSGLGQQTRDDQGTGVIADSLAPGTYYLSVEPRKLEQLGRFTLHIEFIHGGSSATALVPR